MSRASELRADMAVKLITILRDVDGVDEPGSYSGRGMYGARCVSVTTRLHEAEVILAIVERALECLDLTNADDDATMRNLIYVLKSTRSDSMGLERVYYWPSLKWTDDLDAEGGA